MAIRGNQSETLLVVRVAVYVYTVHTTFAVFTVYIGTVYTLDIRI
jgi:hypothetical protein